MSAVICDMCGDWVEFDKAIKDKEKFFTFYCETCTNQKEATPHAM